MDPDTVRRLSLSELQLEKAAETHGKEIVRYCQLFVLVLTHFCCECSQFVMNWI